MHDTKTTRTFQIQHDGNRKLCQVFPIACFTSIFSKHTGNTLHFTTQNTDPSKRAFLLELYRDMHPITGIISRQILQCLMRLFCWHYQCCCFKFWNSGSITDLRVDCLLTCLKIECELMSLFPWIAHLLFCVHSAFRSASYYIQLLVDIKVLTVCLSEKNSSG